MSNDTTIKTGDFQSFAEFYPFYLREHSDTTCRRLHFVGSTLVLMLITFAIITGQPVMLWGLPILGYGFAWVGHFFFEKNKPATFKYPLYSLAGDWVMYKDILLKKVEW